jgi:hypothetical protein
MKKRFVAQDVAWSSTECVVVLEPSTGAGEEWQAGGVCDGSQSMAGAAITVQEGKSRSTGSAQLRLACSTWVYNCTGLPLGVRACSSADSDLEEVAREGQMGAWVSPFHPHSSHPDIAAQAAHPSPRVNAHVQPASWAERWGGGLWASAAQAGADANPALVMLHSSMQHSPAGAEVTGTVAASAAAVVSTVPWPGMLSSGVPNAEDGLTGVPLSQHFDMSVELSAGCSVDPEMWSGVARVARLGIPAVAEVMLPEWYGCEGARLPPGSLQVFLPSSVTLFPFCRLYLLNAKYSST